MHGVSLYIKISLASPVLKPGICSRPIGVHTPRCGVLRPARTGELCLHQGADGVVHDRQDLPSERAAKGPHPPAAVQKTAAVPRRRRDRPHTERRHDVHYSQKGGCHTRVRRRGYARPGAAKKIPTLAAHRRRPAPPLVTLSLALSHCAS